MLVAGVERVVRALDEDFAPLKKARRREAGQSAQDHFLEEGCLHSEQSFYSRRGAIPRLKRVTLFLPKSPLLRLHNPKTQQQICEAMCKHAGRKAACPVRNQVVKRPGYERGGPVQARMAQRECHANDGK
jgi:hypothetical protein